MTRRFGYMLALFACVVILRPASALADDTFKSNEQIWLEMDACTRQAQKAYPDYTRESNEKREKFRLLCLRRGNLPGDDGPVPPPQSADKKE